VEHDIHIAHDLSHQLCIANISANELDVGALLSLVEVGEAAGRQVVEHSHCIAAERINQMRADEPGTTGDKILSRIRQ
jgi:hypothetical protein